MSSRPRTAPVAGGACMPSRRVYSRQAAPGGKLERRGRVSARRADFSLGGVNADANMNPRDRYVERLIEDGSAIALPELRASRLPDALYQVSDRGGLSAVALPETALDERRLDALARFRFAQY